MKLKRLGKNTSKIEVLNISIHGLWIYVNGKEYFLSYEDFPWFKKARLSEVYNVQLLNGYHLCWPSLDVDLELASLSRLEEYPLLYR